MLETFEEGLWWKEFDACGGKLKGQRETIKESTDGGDSGSVGFGEGEFWFGGANPLEEEGDGWVLRQVFAGRQRVEMGKGKWEHGKFILTANMQDGAAGNENFEPGAVGEQLG